MRFHSANVHTYETGLAELLAKVDSLTSATANTSSFIVADVIFQLRALIRSWATSMTKRPSTFPHCTFSSWAVMSSRLKLEARGGFPWCPVAALMVPAGDALVLLLLLLAPLLPPPPLTLLLLLPLPPPPPLLLPPPGCGLLLRPAGGFWRT